MSPGYTDAAQLRQATATREKEAVHALALEYVKTRPSGALPDDNANERLHKVCPATVECDLMKMLSDLPADRNIMSSRSIVALYSLFVGQ